MRAFCMLFMLGALMAGSALAEEAPTEVKRVRVGETLILNFPGNREAGHRWRLIEGESQGLERVDVFTIGWLLAQKSGRRLFGATDMMRFGVRPKSPGESALVFRSKRTGLHGQDIYQTKRFRVVGEAKSARN